jgi:hypothetical protein
MTADQVIDWLMGDPFQAARAIGTRASRTPST